MNTDDDRALEPHPGYGQVLAAYREARSDWHRYTSMREVAEGMGMTERAYCDRRVAMTQLAWSSTTTCEPLGPAHCHHAYASAAPEPLPAAVRTCPQPEGGPTDV